MTKNLEPRVGAGRIPNAPSQPKKTGSATRSIITTHEIKNVLHTVPFTIYK